MTKSPTVKTVRHGSLSIDVKRFTDGRFGFDYKPTEHERQKVRLQNLDDAVVRAEELLGVGQAGKLSLLHINPDEYAEFLQWKAARRAASPLIPAIANSFLEEKRRLQNAKELSEKHVRDLDGVITKFSEMFKGRLNELERQPVEQWINGLGIGPRRFNNLRTHLVCLVNYARSHNWISAEVHPIEQIPRRKVTTKKETYTPTELGRILQAVPTEWLPAIVLGAFCGLRPEEICPDMKSHKPPLKWENVLWAKSKIDVPAAVAKDGRRRFVPLCDAAMAFLARWRNARGRVVPNEKMSALTASWARTAKLPHSKWKYDALRHSYASYRLAITSDIAALSLEMGNSVKMIHDHYLDLQFEETAIEYFGIRPEKLGLNLQPDNIVQFA